MINVFPFFKKHFAGCLILITSMALGFIIFGNYGIAWDEPEQREVGLKTFNYVFHGDTSLNEFKDRYYGVAVELPLIFLEKTLRLEDPRAIYRMRHSVTHLFFLLCAFIFYLLIWVLFRNKPLAVAGYLMLLLSPRIYAQSFFNTKDIPFMCMFIPCFLASVIAFRDKKILNFIVFGILSGLLINIRIMGIMLPVFVTIMILIDLIKGPLRKKTLVNYGVYIFFMVMVTFLTWPWLWKAPLAHFWEAFTCMSKYKWNGNILVYGNYVRASAIDWMYIPHWFGLTTPLLYLFFGTIGFGFLVTRFLREPGVFLFPTNDRNYLLYLVSFLSPVILVILLHSTLYDGWRQMYFIYPAFLLVAIYGLSALLNSKIFSGDMLRVAIFTLVLLSFTGTASTMVKSHPFEDIYFNSLLSKKDQYLRKTFELDYWGTSYKQALESIAANDRSPVLNIKVANDPGISNVNMLKPEVRKRIRIVSTDSEADYFITNYRWHPMDYDYPKEKKVFQILVQNSEICTAWKLK